MFWLAMKFYIKIPSADFTQPKLTMIEVPDNISLYTIVPHNPIDAQTKLYSTVSTYPTLSPPAKSLFLKLHSHIETEKHTRGP